MTTDFIAALGTNPEFRQFLFFVFYAAIGYLGFTIINKQTRTIAMWAFGFVISLSLGVLAGQIALEHSMKPQLANLVSCLAGMTSLMAIQSLFWILNEIGNNRLLFFNAFRDWFIQFLKNVGVLKRDDKP